MRVLHVSPSFYPANVYGGTISSGYGLCRSLVKLGCDVRILTTDANGIGCALDVNTRTETVVDVLRVRYCKKYFRHSVSASLVGELPTYMRWADLVHLTAVYSFPTFPTLLLARLLNKPVVWSPRGALQRWSGSSRVAVKKMWESASHVLADKEMLTLHVTSADEALQSARRFPKLRTVVIANGVEIPPCASREYRVRSLRLLYLGRLHPIKGVDMLLDACARTRRQFDDFSLRIAGFGDPTYVAALKTIVQDRGLESQVEFVGEVAGASKEKLFNECDVVVVPSHMENFAMVVAESLARGVPVIASKGTPWRDLETHGCGLWVDNGPESLAAAICRIRQMPLREMGERGRRWMQEQYSWENVSSRMLQLYRECVHSQRH